MWAHDRTGGLRMGVETHIVTAVAALPLMLETGPGLLAEMTDGTSAIRPRRAPTRTASPTPTGRDPDCGDLIAAHEWDDQEPEGVSRFR